MVLVTLGLSAAWPAPVPVVLHPIELSSPASAVLARLPEVELAEAEPVPLPSLVPDRPVLVGTSAEPCVAEHIDDPHRIAEEVAGHVTWGEFDQAAVKLGTVSGWLACPAGRVDPPTAHRLWFLRGALALYDGAPAEARRHFLRARAWLDAPWDDNFHQEWRTVYDAADPGPPRSTLRIAWPRPGDPAVWVDGRRVEDGARVSVGPHVVQLDAPGGPIVFAVDLGLDETWLVDPAHVPGEIAPTPADGGALRALALHARPDADRVFLTDGAHAWELTADGGLRTLPAPRGRRSVARAGLGAALGGGAVALGGGVLAWNSWAAGRRIAREVDAMSPPRVATFEEAERRHAAAAIRLEVAQWVAGAGLALTFGGGVATLAASAHGPARPLLLR